VVWLLGGGDTRWGMGIFSGRRRAAVNGTSKEGTHQLIQEWIVNHTNNRDTFNSKSDRSADHRISVDLSSASVPSL
jgi:hypothetical protein